jgi:hypothetical protein
MSENPDHHTGSRYYEHCGQKSPGRLPPLRVARPPYNSKLDENANEGATNKPTDSNVKDRSPSHCNALDRVAAFARGSIL